MLISELKTRIAQVMHRTDLTPQMGNFVADAYERVNRRFGTSFAVGADTDALPAPDLLFLWPALQSANEFIRNGDDAVWAGQQFVNEANQQNITGGDSTVNPYPEGEPPVILPEQPE